MRHITKFFCRSAVMLLLSGLVLGVAGWAMGADTNPLVRWNGREFHLGWLGWNGGGYHMDWGEERAENGVLQSGGSRELEPFERIVVTVDMADISFQWADDYGLDLFWYQDRAMTYEVVDGVLTVESVETSRLDNRYGKGDVIIYLPESAKLEGVTLTADMGDIDINALDMKYLTIHADMGDIFVTDCTVAESLIVTSDMGDISVTDCTIPKSLVASTDMGSIDLSGALAGTLDVSDSMGDISIFFDLPASRFGYDIETDMGEITVDGQSFRERAKKSGGSDSIKIRNDMGDVDVYFSES